MSGGPVPLPTWEQLAGAIPGIAAPMRRYLQQIGCVLRPGSVENADQALRLFAAFLAEQAPGTDSLTAVARRHVEDYKPWLACRPGQNKPRLAPATIAHRLGTLRMFFIRIDEWGWAEAPPRVPMFGGDLPRLDRPLPSALDDAAAARLLRAAQADRRMLVRVAVEVLLRTGLRVSEFTGLPAGAIVLIGAGHWLHVPVGKLGEDRYLPLHPHLVTLIDGYRTAHVDPSNPLLLPRENGRALDRHTVTRMINKAGTAAGLPHIAPGAGLRVRVHLRDLHVLPDQHRVPPRPAEPARPRRRSRPGRAAAAIRATPEPARSGRVMNHDSEYRYTATGTGPCPEHPDCIIICCHRFLCPRPVHQPLRQPGQPRRFCSPACRIAEHRRLRQ